MIIQPKVVDIYHGDTVADFAKAYAFGIRGVIHKATEGRGIQDQLYATRRTKAAAAGLHWGAYHFNSGEDVSAQVANFLAVAEPDTNTLCALDLEDCEDHQGRPLPASQQMSLAGARQWLEMVAAATGRLPILYSGNRIKELIPQADTATRAFFAQHRLWLCEYGPVPRMYDASGHPLPWDKPWIWQFTGDGIGPQPHAIPGIQNNMDINTYDGPDDQLAAEWVGGLVA